MGTNLKELIIQGVQESFEQMERTTPTTKGKRHFVCVLGATYSELFIEYFSLLWTKEN